MPEQTFGIDNLKKVIKFACDFTNQAVKSLEDGWQWLDAASFLDEMMQVPGVVKALPAVKQELADLSETEKTELHAYLVAEFDIPNDKLEGFIEDAVAFSLSAIGLFEKFKAIKK